ncbi:zinc finger, CCHC-type containing protein [Tanacetum coccineum]
MDDLIRNSGGAFLLDCEENHAENGIPSTEEFAVGQSLMQSRWHEPWVHENSRRVRTDPTGPPLEYTTWETVTGAMSGLKGPIIIVVTGKGRSYGALAIGCANKLFMLENITFYVAIYHFYHIPKSCIINAINARRLPLALLVYALMTTSVKNNSVFRSFFEKQKLTGPNFIDWYRQLRLVLSTEDKENYLEHPIPVAPVAQPGQQVPPEALAAHAAWVKGKKEVVVLMLLTMDLDIQRNLAHLGAYDMLQELKAMFSKQAKQELLQTRLGQPVGQNLAVSLILVSLNKDFASFVQNFNMHGMGKTVNELHAMLKLHEETLPKKDANPALHAIRAGRVQKNQKHKLHKAAKGGHGKGKGKIGYAPNNAPFAPKPKTPLPPKKDNPAKDAICHQCGEVGHWRRNCPVNLAELMKKKKLSQGASTSGILTIELYSFPSKSWIYDTGCSIHICITTQGL